ncbi:terminase large subunit [Paenibacillus sp. J5C_2022]|uniref:terminase large subunit n=1 Tax=Paenibacillus sp. J5C2022 TaxID=2977129 RepID=UPI0021CFFF32|nr:terminase TerL endonuclease subunit [Paenibacillus sp. J5C2022]MCU6709411.1 terminase large subunit [Paenibacillus sp. J5C2022]
MNEYANQQIAIQTSGNIDKWIAELQAKYDDDKYYFDADEAHKFHNFVSKLELDKGKKGQKIKLLKFQFMICTSIICVKKRSDGFRRYREAHINIPRKNGKGFIIACIITYLYYCKNEFGSAILVTANTTKQAGELFDTIKYMISNNVTLKKYVKIKDSRKIIEKPNVNSKLQVISSDASNADSYAGLYCILDEIHESKNGALYDKLRTGMGIWDEPLLLTLTTASSGNDPTNLEMELYTYAKEIEAGRTHNESFFYAIYEADKGCKLDDEEQWFKANPALGVFRKYEDVKDLAQKAIKLKTREAAFRRLYLNQHVALEGETAINMNLWRNCIADIRLEELIGLPSWCGLDMSAVNDVTAFVQVFYDDSCDKYIIYPHLFTPKNTLHERSERDNIRYDVFVDKGYMTVLDGDFINFEQLFSYINELNGQHIIEEIGFDRWGAIGIISALEKDYTVVTMGQGGKTMAPAISDFENLLMENRLIISNNPVLSWMAGNVVATDSNGVKYDKKKSRNKIDGIIAMLMGLSRAIANTTAADNTPQPLTEEYLKEFWGME